jgi:hypothetical protein
MSSDIKRQFDSLTDCSICKQTFSDPRILPCVHSFCVQCIKAFSEGKLPGDHIPCPLCQKEFTVPDTGFDGLPKNFFIDQLKDVTRTSSGRHCEGCCDDSTDPALRKEAVSFCVDCHQRFCEFCVDTHRRMRVSQGHGLVEINQDETIRFANRDNRIFFCDKHPAKAIEVYCLNCREAVCLTCFVDSHQSHKCSDVNKVADEFRQQMTNDIENMREVVRKCHSALEEQEKKRDSFSNNVKEIEEIICERAEQLKKIIDSEKQKLLQAVASRMAERIEHIQQVIAHINQRKFSVADLAKYTEVLRDHGAANDVAQQIRNLHDRADELTNFVDVQREVNDLGSMQVSFEAIKFPTEASRCLIGNVKWQHDKGELFDNDICSLQSVFVFRFV